MPSRNNVLNLQVIALQSLNNAMNKLCINSQVSVYDLAAVVSHLKLVPPQVQAEICRTFIETFKKNTNEKNFNEKHIFFCVHLNSEEAFMNEFDRTLLFLNDLKGSHFKKLTFWGSNFPFPENELDKSLRYRLYEPLYDFMSSLHYLTTFQAVRMCDDTMLGLFAEFCPNLEDIEIELSYTVSDEGISYLCGFDNASEMDNYLRMGEDIIRPKGCKNLKRVVLDFTMASNLSVVALLKWCPKIETLEVNPDVDFGDVFIRLLGYESEHSHFPSNRFNLTSLKSYQEIDEKIIYLITGTCPKLQNVALRFYGSERKDKNILAHLQNLPIHSLDLMNCNTEALLWYLEQKGNSITNLVIEHLLTAPPNVFINRHHLQCIISSCTNLIHFSLKMCGNVSISPNIPYSSFGENLKYFTTLKSLYVEGVNLEPEDLKILICKNNDIEDINIMCQSLESLEDSLLNELLACGALKKLKSLFALRPFLTLAGLHRLLSECPLLEKIGPLSSWAIPKRERDRLCCYIKKNNWNLSIDTPLAL